MTDDQRLGPRFFAWLENDLSDEEARLLNTHAADCQECREKLALMNTVQDVGEIRRQVGYRPSKV